MATSLDSDATITDLAIIGAGWHGLTMAKTYLQASPDASIVILDSATSLGGTWAKERCYPGLKTNNQWGSYEWSDFPLTTEKGEEKHVPAQVMFQYMCDAVKEFGIESFLELGRKVERVRLIERDHGGEEAWEIKWRNVSAERECGIAADGVLLAKKLVLATGLTSEPFVPTYSGVETFRGLRIHSKDLTSRAEDLARAKTVVIVGGNKSAWDVAYTVARRGGIAHMIMRSSGAGPNYAWPRFFRFLGWTTSLPCMSLTRFWNLFDPWPFTRDGKIGNGWLRRFLHGWWLGRWITRRFWGHLRYCNDVANEFNCKDERVKMFAPWSSTYWMGGSLGTLNYDTDWFEEVKEGRIVPHHADIEGVKDDSVLLSDGRCVTDVDAMVCCTGWKPVSPIVIEPVELREELGLPTIEPPDTAKVVNSLAASLVEVRPELGNPPRAAHHADRDPTSPFRLYRFLVPPSPHFLQSRNFACIGINYSLNTAIVSQAQALWITAFFNNHISSLQPERGITSTTSPSSLREQTLLHTTYETLRRPKSGNGFGEKHPDLVFDSLPYVDMLLHDLGIKTNRKGGSWWREWFEAYELGDYRGLVEEWKTGQGTQSS